MTVARRLSIQRLELVQKKKEAIAKQVCPRVDRREDLWPD